MPLCGMKPVAKKSGAIYDIHTKSYKTRWKQRTYVLKYKLLDSKKLVYFKKPANPFVFQAPPIRSYTADRQNLQ